MGQLVILSCNLLSSFSDLTAGGVSKRRWRADGERERRRFGVGRGWCDVRGSRRVPVEQDEAGLKLFLLLAKLGKLKRILF